MAITASSPDAFFDGEDFEWTATLTEEDGVTPLVIGPGDRLFARFTVIASEPHLDEFVAFQMYVAFAQHGRCQPGISDQHDGFKMMRQRAQLAADGGGEFKCHGASVTQRGAVVP